VTNNSSHNRHNLNKYKTNNENKLSKDKQNSNLETKKVLLEMRIEIDDSQ
jgi:hypothetical protein